jgi:tetratricopeptide (TPR) repeat protein
VESYCLLGEACLAAGDFGAAEAAFAQAAEIEPPAACSFYGRLAENYRRLGACQREEEALGRCLKFRPEDPLYHCRQGDCLIGQGRLAEARGAYERACKLAPPSSDVFCCRWGAALAAARYHQEAIEVFRAVPPGAAGYPRALAQLAASYQALGRADRAAAVLTGHPG